MTDDTQAQNPSLNGPGEEWWDADFDPEAFRRLGHQAVDMMAEYFATLRERPVFPGVDSAVVKAAFNDPLPL